MRRPGDRWLTLNGTGNSSTNIVTGNTGNNTLDGGSGTDTFLGGGGNDVYLVDSTSDIVTELVGEGLDEIRSSVAYTLSAEVENLVLTGSSSINGTGNTLANNLTGNSAANTLDGKTGADTLTGGGGNDTYVVDDAGDVVIEGASSGTDLVQASVSYTASANVENLTLTGTAAINATGNSLANALVGNSGDKAKVMFETDIWSRWSSATTSSACSNWRARRPLPNAMFVGIQSGSVGDMAALPR